MNISTLLGWAELFPAGQYGWMGNIFGTISIVLYVIMGIVGAAGAVYAIYLGVQLARAEDQGKRDDAKKHLITVLIAVAVTIVLILFFNELLPLIVKAFIGADVSNPTKPENNQNTGGNAGGMINAFNALKSLIIH